MSESRLRRALRWSVIIVGVLIFVAVAAIVAVRLYYTDARLTALIREQVKKHVPLDVKIGEVSLRLLSGIVVRDVVVGPPTSDYKEDILQLAELRLGYRLWPLIKRQVAVDEVAVIAPVIVLEMAGDKWNALAAADKFKSDKPKEPEPEPASEPSEPQPLGFEVDLSAVMLENMSARVISPAQNASVDRINARVSGTYSGDKAEAKVHFFIGEDAAPASVAFDVKDLGKGTLKLVFDVVADVASLNEVRADIRMRASGMNGEAAGFALPPLPLDLSLSADANLVTQKANVPRLELALGNALSMTVVAKASEFLGDPDLDVAAFDLAVDLAPALRLLPKDMLPVAADGKVRIGPTSVKARLSELKAQSPFDAAVKLRLEHVGVTMGELAVSDVNGELNVKVDRNAGVDVGGNIGVAAVRQGELAVNGARVGLAVKAPISALQQKLDAPLTAQIDVTVPEVLQPPMIRVAGTKLKVDATAHDLAGARANADITLGVDALEIEDAKLGRGRYPVALSLAVERRAPAIAIKKLALSVGEKLIAFGLKGNVVQRPQSAFDLDLEATLDDVDLARLVAAAPSLQKKELEAMALAGTAGLTLSVKGYMPGDIAAQLKKPPLVILDNGTPFSLDVQVGWQGIGATFGENTIAGLDGALALQTQPKREHIQLDTQVKSYSAPDKKVGEINVSFDGEYMKGEARGTAGITAGSTTLASNLTKTLKNTKLDLELVWHKGVELIVKRLAVNVPTLGTQVSVRARVDKPEDVYTKKAWESPTYEGIEAEATIDVGVALPERNMKLLPGKPMTVSGGGGVNLGLEVAKSTIKVNGALRAAHLDLEDDGLLVKNANGMFPFKQDLTKTAAGFKPVLSNEDILKKKDRIAYYADLRSYGRDDEGLRVDRVVSGKNELKRVALNGSVEQGKLHLDYFSMNVLSGDVEGQLAAQLGADKVFRTLLAAKFSNLDLSVLSNTKPGPESQINGNMQVQLEWGEKFPRELDQTTFNITKVGSNMLGALLHALDPEDKNQNLVNARKQVDTYKANINLLRLSVFHNTANVDLDTTTFLSTITFGLVQLIDRAAARRLDIKPRLEASLAPVLDKQLGPLLGWSEKKETP